MFVKKFKLNRSELDENTFVDVPLDTDHQSVDNSEVIDREFVDGKVKKNTNPIIDYDKFRFKPFYEDSDGNLNEIKVINYRLFFLVSGSYTTNVTTYDQIGITQNDLKFRKNRFTNSFLRLNFYDTDITTDQNLLTFSDLFCSLRIPTDDEDLGISNKTDIDTSDNLPKDASNIPVLFELTNPSLTPSRIHEGVHLYWFKDDVPRELYMQATFNNAANGVSTDFMNEEGPFAINNLTDKLHIKFNLNKYNGNYYYLLDDSYANTSNIININTLNSGNVELNVDLYEINVS